MNFLAHLFLSYNGEELTVGNFLADFLKNRELKDYSGGILEGIHLHRKIDSFTDAHPVVLRSVRRLYPYHHKYASVIVDVFYDFFLAKNWCRFTSQNIRTFSTQIYSVLKKHQSIMPARIHADLDLMIKDDWLIKYAHRDGIAYVFGRLRDRLSKPDQLDGVMDSLERDHDALNQEFNQFFQT